MFNRNYILLVIIISAIVFNLSALAFAEEITFANTDEVSSVSTEKDAPTSKLSEKEDVPVLEEAQIKDLIAGSIVPPPEEIFAGGVGKGALMSPLLNESFQTDLATGAATASIPIVTPPGRKNMQPSIALSYSSNNSNGICGVGWGLTTSCIQRSTKKGAPKYNLSDQFMFSSSGSSGELVLVDETNNEYRQKIETGFMKYIYDSPNSKWMVFDKNGLVYTFGSLASSRMLNPDKTKIFAWFLDKVEDVYGNAVNYIYSEDEGQVYLSAVEYTSNAKVIPNLTADKRIEFVYEAGRLDISRNYRATWLMQTNWLLKEIHIKVDGQLKWKYVLSYTQSADTKRSLLSQITVFDGNNNFLPAKKFTYQTIN